jgi:hypothetical protein
MDCSFSTPPIVAVLGCHIAEAKVCWKSHDHRILIRLMSTRDGVGAPALFFRKVIDNDRAILISLPRGEETHFCGAIPTKDHPFRSYRHRR